MSAINVARRYLEAWNLRKTEVVLATFSESGTYTDPKAGHNICREEFAAYMKKLWLAFPDLQFEIVSIVEADGGLIAAQWIMRGTNTGSFLGLPPTGKKVELPGADFIRVYEGKILSVTGYFDSQAVPRQLGLQIIIQPDNIGPFVFGSNRAVHGTKFSTPGAFSITALHAKSNASMQQIGQLAQLTVQEAMKIEGFLGWTGITIGESMLTVTAWESTDCTRKLMQTPAHQEAVRQFYGPDLVNGGWTSTWVPEHIRTMIVRCSNCAGLVDYVESKGRCECGAMLPEPAPYW